MYSIKVSIYAQAKQFHYAKLEIDGVYISGIKVCASKKFDNSLWIQMPSFKKGKEWKRYIEIANDSVLGKEIYEAIELVAGPRIFAQDGKQKDVVLEDIDDRPIDFSEIPF